ncbi:MAG: hypothetical protein M9962_00725 [Oligoflexia bacterium]|nr:hypothetical protein [Oligoflexia bacterium]
MPGSIITLFLSTLALSAGFSSGNSFTAHNIYGAITIYCEDPFENRRESVYVHCQDQILNPVESDYFLAGKYKAGTKLEVLSTQESGKQIYKKVPYKGKEGQSSSPLNLWISTLLQTPLLAMGDNKIDFELHDRDWKTLSKGRITVRVREGEANTCRYQRTYFSRNLNDCRTPQTLCRQYFQEENYCQ